MKNKIFRFLLLVSLMSCTEREVFFSEDLVKEYSRGDFILPSRYGYLNIFVLADSSKETIIAKTGINQLHTMYKNEYSDKYHDFSSFVYDALNQKIEFQPGYLERRNAHLFSLDSKVKEIYEKSELTSFIKQYCNRDSKQLVIKKNDQSDEQLMSVIYFLFINGYEITNDDYLGAYYARKLDLKTE